MGWRPVVGYEGYYEVSDIGQVRGVARDVYHGNGTYRKQHSKVLRPHPDGGGYLQVGLHREGSAHMAKIHRLVAIAFLPNPGGLLEINHLDENKRNNALSNLEWCTRKENENYGTKRMRSVANTDYKAIGQKLSKRVAQYTLDGELVNVWDSLRSVHKATGYSTGNISMCCTGRHRNGLYGYVWVYV